MKHGKNYRNALKKYDNAALFSVSKAVDLVKELKFAKFDETVEVHVSLKLGKNQRRLARFRHCRCYPRYDEGRRASRHGAWP